MRTTAPVLGRWQRLGLWLQAQRQQYDQVQGEASMESLRKFQVFTVVTLLVNIFYIAKFWISHDTEGLGAGTAYAERIGWVNLWMAVAAIATGLLGFRLLRRDARASPAAIALQLLVCACVLVFAVAVAVVDQMVIPSITPFVIVCMVVAVLSLMRPAMALPVFGISYLLLHQALPLTQVDPAVLSRLRNDGLLVVVLSLAVSTLVFRQYVAAVVLRRDVVRANQSLAEKQAELAFNATHDDLTGLINRREFIRLATLELARTSRVPGTTCILLLDIDFFKKINDQHGHPAGDEVLQQVARLLTHGVRGLDVVARLGGEEFIVLLPNTGRIGALAVAEKLRATLEQTPLHLQSVTLPVTASFGVSELPAGTHGNLEDLYKAADQALYVAKRQGRNRVEFDVAHLTAGPSRDA